MIVGLLLGDDDWRKDKAKLRVAAIATILWACLSGLRLAVQLPLYLAECDGGTRRDEARDGSAALRGAALGHVVAGAYGVASA